jgi:hypothetical protein
MMKRGRSLNIRHALCAPIAAFLTPGISDSKKTCADFCPRGRAALGPAAGIGCYFEVIHCKETTISVDP